MYIVKPLWCRWKQATTCLCLITFLTYDIIQQSALLHSISNDTGGGGTIAKTDIVGEQPKSESTMNSSSSSKSSKESIKGLKVMLYVTTHMSAQHIWYLKSCWIPALQNSLLLRSSDVMVHLNPSNDTLREEAKKLLKETFQNQMITIHDRSNLKKQAGAKAALEDAAKEGWFKGYDWVIRVNPDVIIRNDTYILDVMQNDPNATAILINCAHFNPQNPKVHTDFFAIKPGALAPNTFINSTIGNAELSFTNDIRADIMNKGNHRWIENSEPKKGICKAGYYRKEDERHVTHSHVGEDILQGNFTCPIPF
jgi:hypothetical protein